MKRFILLVIVYIGICSFVMGQVSGNMSAKRSDLKTAKTGEYDKISLDNVLYTDVVGQPELPVYIQSFVIPLDAQITGIKINNMSKQKLEGTYYIHPVQPPIPISLKDSVHDFGLPDPAIYNSVMPYPGKQAEIISDELYLGYRIVTVRLYPVEYIPQSKELYFCNFDFSIDYSIMRQARSNEFVMQTQSLYRYELNKKAVRFRVENPGDVDNYNTKVQKVTQGKTVVYDFSTISNEKVGLRSQTVSVIDEQIPEYIIRVNVN